MKRIVLFLFVLVFSIFSNTNNLLAKEIENNIKDNISNKIINNVKGINRVVYDISSKPPSTIELE